MAGDVTSANVDQVASVTKNLRINSENWDRFMRSQQPSTNVEDRRSPESTKYEDLVFKVRNGKSISKQDQLWLDQYVRNKPSDDPIRDLIDQIDKKPQRQ